MSEAALKERQRKCLQERRKARTSQTKAAWTTLRALGRCRGGGEVFPRRAGRGTRAEPGRRSPALSTPRRTRRSLSKAGRSRDTSRARETITSAINAKENKEKSFQGGQVEGHEQSQGDDHQRYQRQ